MIQRRDKKRTASAKRIQAAFSEDNHIDIEEIPPKEEYVRDTTNKRLRVCAYCRVSKVLVVSPKSIVGVWEEEFQKFADYRYALTILDGSIAKKKAAFGYMNGSALQVIVVNYESAWRLETEIGKWNPDMIVCDESSKIKNPATAQSKALHKLGKKTKFNVILTGTPVTNNPLDFFSQYKFLDEEILGPSYYLFRNRYAVMGGYQNHQIVGYNHLPELVEKVHKIAFRIKIQDAVDLPPFIDEVRTIKLEPKAEAVYRMIEEDCYAQLSADTEVTARNILTQLLRLSQCTGGFTRLLIEAYNESIDANNEVNGVTEQEDVLRKLIANEQELRQLRAKGYISESKFREETDKILIKIKEQETLIKNLQTRDMVKGKYKKSDELTEQMAEFLVKATVKDWTITFEFQNGYKATKEYTNGRAGNVNGKLCKH